MLIVSVQPSVVLAADVFHVTLVVIKRLKGQWLRQNAYEALGIGSTFLHEQFGGTMVLSTGLQSTWYWEQLSARRL